MAIIDSQINDNNLCGKGSVVRDNEVKAIDTIKSINWLLIVSQTLYYDKNVLRIGNKSED